MKTVQSEESAGAALLRHNQHFTSSRLGLKKPHSAGTAGLLSHYLAACNIALALCICLGKIVHGT